MFFSLVHHEDLILPEIFITTFLLVLLKRQNQTWQDAREDKVSLEPGRGWANSSQPMDELQYLCGGRQSRQWSWALLPSLHSTSKSCYCHHKTQFASDAKMPGEQTGQIYHAECIYSKSFRFCLLNYWKQSEVNEKGTSKHSCSQTSFNVCFPQGQTCILMLHNVAIIRLFIWQNNFFPRLKIAFLYINPILMMRHVHQDFFNLKLQPY